MSQRLDDPSGNNRVEAYLRQRYEDNLEVQYHLIELYREYATWNLKDSKFDQDFTDGRDEHFYAYLWEMLLARHFKAIGLTISSADNGPDLKVVHEGKPIWVEAICPSPAGLPAQWLEVCPAGEFRVQSVPHEEMLLRWTAALKEKKEKLTGRIHLGSKSGVAVLKPGYLDRGLVSRDEPYVVAVSACRLGLGSLLLDYGISQMPFAVEAAFPVGPIELVVEKETLKTLEQRHSYRPVIKKPSGREVPTDNFLNPDYAGVSAILGTSAGVNAACGDKPRIVLVHNPLATNRLAVGILGADEEYVAEDKGDHYELREVGGNWSI